jgi:hypothetical protein
MENKVLFVGDLAIGSEDQQVFLNNLPLIDNIVVNLEGPFYLNRPDFQRFNRSFYNSVSTLNFIKNSGISHVNILNNHISDLGSSTIKSTIAILHQNQVGVLNYDELNISEVGSEMGVISLGSRLISCPSNWPNIEDEGILAKVSSLISNSRFKRIVLYVHCGFEFEKHPEPWLRNRLIALAKIQGITHIICVHSHVSKGFEKVGECLIFYGLGNFYIENEHFFSGKLKYPKECNKGLAIMIDNHKTRLFMTIKEDWSVSFVPIQKSDLINYGLISDYVGFYNMNRRKYRFMLLPPHELIGASGRVYVWIIELRFILIKLLIPFKR